MQLTRLQKLQFHHNSYLKIPGAVPRIMVDRALRAINHSLDEQGTNRDHLPTLRARPHCTEVQQDSAKTGDAILAHHLVVHTAAPNASAHVRYAAFFRLHRKNCEENGPAAYTGIRRESADIRGALYEIA